MMTFFLAMALHPNIMRKVQHDLDAVTGRDRLPTFEDRERLPFIDAVCREVLRWQPVTPLGEPNDRHSSGISRHLHCSRPARDYRRQRL
jgi:cytochrome P450